MKKPNRDRVLSKDMIRVRKEAKSEEKSRFFALIPKSYKKKLKNHLAETGEKQYEWLTKVIEKL